MFHKLRVVLLFVLVLSFLSVGQTLANPEEYHQVPVGYDPADGPPLDDHQHGSSRGHLPASSSNVELVGKVQLTSVVGGVADVAALGNYAYLAAFHPECAGRNPGSQGTGVHVVDISNPANPVKVGFLPAEPNSYVGEGVHVMRFGTRDILVHNNETCRLPVTSGFSLWDVTNPLAPVKLGQFGDNMPRAANQTYHATHSVQGFVWQGRAYAVAQDTQELKDVDIFDITPAIEGTGPAVLIAERGLEDWPGAHGPYANGESVSHHDMQQKTIDGHNYLLVSYWDAGQVLLNIDDPANPIFLGDSDYPSPDLAGFAIAEGNSHQSYWSEDGKFVLSTDEDFSPTRTLCTMQSSSHAELVGCGEFTWTRPLAANFPGGLDSARAVWGGSGCVEDVNANGRSDRAEVPAVSGSNDIIVFSRGVCPFSDKVRSGEAAGYRVVAIGNSHAGSRNGLLPDGFICGSQGSPVLGIASALCLGHQAMHQLFSDTPGYSGADLADMPVIGAVGGYLSARGVFDGWGYIRLHDGNDPNLSEIDTYAVPEALDPAYASGFGTLTVHEVKTDPRRGVNLAYASYYDAGLRVLSFGPEGLAEVGHYIAEGGNDFWGVYPLLHGQGLINDRDQGRGRHNEKRPLLLMSDRDSGLWIFRYTGKE